MLFGAPHDNGATGELLRRYTAAHAGAVTVIDCYKRAVRPCDDCRACHRQRGCSKRDMDDVYDAIEQADRLVFVTPVYNRSFPAPMKAMIDRLQCYWALRFVHNVRPPIAKPKTAVLLTVCGSDREDGELVLRQLEPALTVLHVTDTAALHVKGSDTEIDWDTVAKRLENI